MKTLTRLFIFGVFISASDGYAQTKSDGVFPHVPLIPDSLANTLPRYDFATRKANHGGLFQRLLERNGAQTNFKSAKPQTYFDTHVPFNVAMLNVFFQNEIKAFTAATKDISLEKYFATVNTDKTLSIGRTFDLRKPTVDLALKPMHNFLTLYAKGAVDENYSTVYSKNAKTGSYEFASGIGVGVRYNRFGNGILFFDKDPKIHKEKIKSVRDKAVKGYIDGEIFKYLKSDFSVDKAEIDALNATYAAQQTETEKLVEKKYYEFYKKISDKEIEYLKKNKLYYSYLTYWVGCDAYVPLVPRKFIYKEVATVGDTIAEEYRDYKFEVFGNILWSSVKGWSVKTRVGVSKFNNNYFLAEGKTPVTYQNISNQSPTSQVLGTSKIVFIGKYDEFWTTAVSGEIALLFFNNSAGISGSITKNYGTYDKTNWKVGFPFSLKDKDDKPTVNFEVQWKEINGERSLGIAVAYTFGTFK